jgi:alcohol dehydrogenase class IV
MAVPSSSSPLYGLWQPPSHLKNLFYGLSCVEKHMLSVIPFISSKVLILTGRLIATKTPLVQQLESLLSTHHAATFSEIEQHGQVHGVNQAFEIVLNNSSIDTIVSIGGGSPIDSAKTISHRIHEERGTTLTHINHAQRCQMHGCGRIYKRRGCQNWIPLVYNGHSNRLL